jgi:hypothetical protein
MLLHVFLHVLMVPVTLVPKTAKLIPVLNYIAQCRHTCIPDFQGLEYIYIEWRS